MLVAGFGLVAYSYVGALVTLAGEIERAETPNAGAASFMELVGYMMSGEIPQMTNYLYGGAFLIVVAVIMLIVRKKPNDE